MQSGQPYVAVFDLETQDAIASVLGSSRDEKVGRLQVSCGSVLCLPSEFVASPLQAERAMELSVMRTFWRDGERRNNMSALIRLLEGAELIVGYNLVGFDWIVMRKYYDDYTMYERHRARTHDLFSRVRDATGVWFKLDRLLELNGFGLKTADGLQAIKMWADGRRAELQHYCECDVRQCARLGLLTTLNVGAVGGVPLDNYVFGIAAALVATHFSNELNEDDAVHLVQPVVTDDSRGGTAKTGVEEATCPNVAVDEA